MPPAFGHASYSATRSPTMMNDILLDCVRHSHMNLSPVPGISITLNWESLLNSRANVLSKSGRKHHNAIIARYSDGDFLLRTGNFCSPARFRSGRLAAKKSLCFARNKFAEEEEEDPKSGDLGSKKLGDKLGRESLQGWSVPWDGKTVVITMTSFGLSFLLTGLSLSVLIARLGFGRRQLLDLDEQAVLIFTNQLLQTIFGTTVINFCINRYKPLPNDLFNYDWRNPFDLNRGWLLWGVVGVAGGAAAVLFAGTLTTALNGQPLPREEQDALLQLLPLIGASRTSTALLVAVTGILAPYLEETVFRGFLMTSLTKWMPIPAAVILSASAFALAHFTPGEIPQLFALGVVLGFAYAKTHNLLTPIMIHAVWNSGVVLLLTVLRLQGYDLQELI